MVSRSTVNVEYEVRLLTSAAKSTPGYSDRESMAVT
jgi:hypothetical protein